MSTPKGWPWNNQPSTLHQWRMVSQGGIGGHTAKCDRCGRSFIERADTRGPVYCFPTTEWLAQRPADKAAGIDKHGRACGEYGRPLADKV